MNPLWTRIHRLLWCNMIGVISGHRSWSGTSRRNGTLCGYFPRNSCTRLRQKKTTRRKIHFFFISVIQWPFIKMYFVAILDSDPWCYECTDPVKFEECAVNPCIVNNGKCYYSGKQQDSIMYNKYGCIQPQYCNKRAEDGNVIQCCEGSLCNKG